MKHSKMITIRLQAIVILIYILSHHVQANREFINGTNYKCNEEGNLIELPNYLRKPCILCICSKGSVRCEKLNQCQTGNRPDRKRRSIRCIEEECCNIVDDLFLNNHPDGGNRLVSSYRTVEESSTSEIINNQVRTTSIRYVHCPTDHVRNSRMNSQFSELLNNNKSNPHRTNMNTRSVTATPNVDSNPSTNPPVCTLSNRFNSDSNKHRQYITTFDDMKMRLRYKNHCHFVFARDCAPEQLFTIHLLYSGDHSKKHNDQTKSIHRSNSDKFTEFINKNNVSNELDGQSTSNYTQRYLKTLKQSQTSSKEHLGLFIRIGKRKIQLDANLNVRLDNHPTLLPYIHRGIKIVYYQNHIIIKSDIGLKLVWSGQEVVTYLPSHFRGRTCGLCGNFNGNLTDDIKNRKGEIVQSQLRFVQSWVTGKNRHCMMNKHHRTINDRQPLIESNSIGNDLKSSCKYTFKRKMKATRFCNSLKIDLPSNCHKSLGIDNYYEDCMKRMCACNQRNCMCEILSSYVDKCSNLLIDKSNQFNMTMFQSKCPNHHLYHINRTLTIQPNNNTNQSRSARTLDLLKFDKRPY